MKKIFIFATILVVLYACKPPQYVPVESVKIEYRDKIVKDSIYRLDSVHIRERGDTVIFERHTLLYRDKIVKDSVYINDTVRVPYPVEVPKPTKTLTGWQNFQLWCGRIFLTFFLFAVLILWRRGWR